LLYRSSAGSGKTYNLAREYLCLALKYPDNYKRILAVTFTNKSTNEMKSRIVDQLAALSVGDVSSDLALYLMDKLGFDQDKLQIRATDVLSKILHSYSFFSVSTIDRFFQRIVSAFARETGISGGYGIELDQQTVLTEVIDQMYREIAEDKHLKDWLVRYSEAQVNENKSWDVRKELVDRGMDLLKEDYLKVAEKEESPFKADEDKVAFIRNLQEKKAKIEYTLSGYAKEALIIIERHGLDIHGFAHKASGVGSYFLKISRKEIDEPNSYVLKALADRENWSAKTSPDKSRILAALDDGLFDQLQRIIEYYEAQKRTYFSILTIQPLFYGFAILLEIEKRLSDYRQENRVILISDLTRFIRKIIGGNDAPFIYEKTGTIYQHFLIDEFQDTSSFQWDNFKPLIENALAHDKLCLVVGDIKQSIYRWRGGDWRIITDGLKQDIGQPNIETRELDTNWRSLPIIVGFNNYVFKNAPAIIADLLSVQQEVSEGSGTAGSIMEEAYADAIQRVAEKNAGESISGKIQIQFYDDDKDGDLKWKDKVLNSLPETMESIQDDGISVSDIAILVRGKKDGESVANFLMNYRNSEHAKPGYTYDIISSESLFLSSSYAIRIIINAMKLLYDPDDRIALFNILYYNHQLGDSGITDMSEVYPIIAEHQTNDPIWKQFLPEAFLNHFQNLANDPIPDLAEELIRMFKLGDHSGEYSYLLAFHDAILDYTKKSRGDLDDFLNWWQEKGDDLSIQESDGLEAARILTIHKSKGLQFKAVIIPFCDWDLDHSRKSPIIWCRSDDPVFNAAGHLPVKYSSKLKRTFFEEDYYSEQIMAHMDNLNLLYVAMTRAEKVMYVSGKVPAKEKNGKVKIRRGGDLLYDLVSDCKEKLGDGDSILNDRNVDLHWDPERNLFSLGKVIAQKEIPESGQTNLLTEYLTGHWSQKIRIKSEEKKYFEDDIKNGFRSRINYGLVVHDILSTVIYKHQLQTALIRSVIEGTISEEEKNTLKQKIEKLWQNPMIDDWFSENWQIKTEVPVLPKTGDLHRLDRVMIKDKKAVVLDYKTGSPTKKDKDQVREYIILLREMGFTDVEGYLLMLESNDLLKVEE